MEKIIEVTGLEKSYGNVHAVKGIDFYVEKGKLFAFLGPNGAGKSTTIDMICTFLKPDKGGIMIDGLEIGRDDDKIRSVIGCVFQDGLLDKLLTVEENLSCRGGLYGLKGRSLKEAINKTADICGIKELLKRPYGKLSGGQRRRCDVARALINTPKILILDEPTTGLDPQTRKSIWETIMTLQRETEMTLFLTTHYMEEAAAADYVIVIDDGRIIAKGTPAELKEEHTRDRLLIYCTDKGSIVKLLENGGYIYHEKPYGYEVMLESTVASIGLLENLKGNISGFEVLKGSMDDVFISITGKEIRE